MDNIWNPWHGCKKYSEGCKNCYMYFLDKQRNPLMDSSIVFRTNNFDLPLKKNRQKEYKVKSGQMLMVNMTSDTFIEEADEWRDEMWRIIKERSDVIFYILTKRASRIKECLPSDWGDGYENVILNVTCENQQRADERIPILLDVPAKHKGLCIAPILSSIDIEEYLRDMQIEQVSCGGENYDGARLCDYEWIKSLSRQCEKYRVNFDFFETGTYFMKDDKIYHIPNKKVQAEQAYKSGISRHFYDIDYKLVKNNGILVSEKDFENFMYNKNTCIHCSYRQTCSGCSNCGKCKNVELISRKELNFIDKENEK